MTDDLKTGRKQYKIFRAGFGPPMVVEHEEKLSAEEVLKRIAKLAEIRRDLESALLALSALEFDAKEKQAEHAKLSQLVAELVEDKKTAEGLLSLPENSVGRLLQKAGAKARLRGLLEGTLIVSGKPAAFFPAEARIPRIPPSQRRDGGQEDGHDEKAAPECGAVA